MPAVLSAVPVLTSGTNVTVPATATAVVALWGYYENAAGGGINTLALANNPAFNPIIELEADPAVAAGGAAWAQITATGTQQFTFSWDFGAVDEGPILWLVFVNDVDTSNFVRGSDADRSAGTSQNSSVASETSDFVLALCLRYSSGGPLYPPLQTGYTNLGTDGQLSIYSRVSVEETPASGTTAYASGHGDFPLNVVVSIRDAPAGGGGSSPTPEHPPRLNPYRSIVPNRRRQSGEAPQAALLFDPPEPTYARHRHAYGAVPYGSRGWLGAPSSGTSPVQRDFAVTYGIRNNVSRDFAATYSIRSNVQRDFSATYSIRNNVQRDFAASYAIRQNVQRDFGVTYVIENTGASAVFRDFAFTYAVQAAVQRDFAATWSIRASVQRDFGATYGIRNNVQRDFSATWSTRSNVTRDFSATYQIRSNVQRDFALSWTIESLGSPVFRDFAFTYQVVGKVQRDFAFSWRVGDEQQRVYGGRKQRDDGTEEFVRKWWEYAERAEKPDTTKIEHAVREFPGAIPQSPPKADVIELPPLTQADFDRMLAEALARPKVAPTSEVTDTLTDDFLTIIAIAEADDWP